MADVKIYNDSFESVGTETYKLDLSSEVISVPAIHQVVKATLAGRRQGTASTKNRSAVRGGGAKPFKQKGTGNARRGSSRSPLLVGGGRAFGPTPRDFSQKVNKKAANKAIQSVLADKLNNEALFVVDNFNSDGKTKTIATKLEAKGMLPALIVSDNGDKVLFAARNIRQVKTLGDCGFSVYEAVKFKNLIIEKKSFNKIVERLG